MAVELLPESLWLEVEPMLSPESMPSLKGGRPGVSNRDALKGILFVLRFGVPWQALPRDLFGVSGSSSWRRFSEWTHLGVWPQLHRRLLNHLGTLGGVGHFRRLTFCHERIGHHFQAFHALAAGLLTYTRLVKIRMR